MDGSFDEQEDSSSTRTVAINADALLNVLDTDVSMATNSLCDFLLSPRRKERKG
jgi:hypothetical protein